MRAPAQLLLLCLALSACNCGDDQLRQVPAVVEEPEVPGCQGAECEELPTCVAQAERCNGVDDDCDGEVDEGLLPLSCGTGECQQIVSSCEGGIPAVCPAVTGQPEVCDGVDNDCDGTVDEDLLTNVSSDLRLTVDPATSDFVYASWTGSRFGVAWQDKRDGAAQNGEIYFAPLDKQGRRLRADDVRVTFTSQTSTHPALAWNGQRFGLVYAEGTSTQMDIWFRQLDPDGASVGTAQKLTSAKGVSRWPDLVWNGTAFGVVWADDRSGRDDLYFRLLAQDGAPLGAERRLTTDPQAQQSPILKWNGSEFGLVWTDLRHGQREVYFRRLSAQGEPLGAELRLTQNTGDSAWPDLAWNGTEWAAVWEDDVSGDDEIYFARISAAGEKLGGDLRITHAPGRSTNPSIDWNGFQYGLSWQDDRGGSSAVYFASVNAAGAKNGNDLRISTGNGDSVFTTALWNGVTFAFSWRDDRDGNPEIYFAYVGCP